jgi:hypothetical protein
MTFSQPWRATYPGEHPCCRLRCALRVSHPPDALLPPRPAELFSSRSRLWGSPFEAFRRIARRTGLSTALTLKVSARSLTKLGPPCQGFTRAPQRAAGSGYSPDCRRRMPPWAFSSGASYPLTVPADSDQPAPHALYRLGRKLTSTRAPQGSTVRHRSRSLSRSDLPPWSFPPRKCSQPFEAQLGRGHPSKEGTVSPRRRHPLLSPIRRLDRGRSRTLFR